MTNRFREIVSVETIVDDATGKRYIGLIDSDFIKLINELHEENEQLKQRNKRLQEKIQRERTSFTKTHERWSKEAENKIKEFKQNWYRQDSKIRVKLHQLKDENEQLKSEINMLKITIGRNEAYIERLTHTGEWSNTSMK